MRLLAALLLVVAVPVAWAGAAFAATTPTSNGYWVAGSLVTQADSFGDANLVPPPAVVVQTDSPTVAIAASSISTSWPACASRTPRCSR